MSLPLSPTTSNSRAGMPARRAAHSTPAPLLMPGAVRFRMLTPGKTGAVEGSTCKPSSAPRATTAGACSGSKQYTVILNVSAAARSTSAISPSGPPAISAPAGRGTPRRAGAREAAAVGDQEVRVDGDLGGRAVAQAPLRTPRGGVGGHRPAADRHAVLQHQRAVVHDVRSL